MIKLLISLGGFDMIVVIENAPKFSLFQYNFRPLVVAILSLALVSAFEVPQASARDNWGGALAGGIAGGIAIGLIGAAMAHAARGRPARVYHAAPARVYHAAPARVRHEAPARTHVGSQRPSAAPEQASPEPANLKVMPPLNRAPAATTPPVLSPSTPVAAPSGPGLIPANTPPSPAPIASQPSGSGPSQVAQPSPTPPGLSPAPTTQPPRTSPAPDEVKPKDD